MEPSEGLGAQAQGDEDAGPSPAETVALVKVGDEPPLTLAPHDDGAPTRVMRREDDAVTLIVRSEEDAPGNPPAKITTPMQVMLIVGIGALTVTTLAPVLAMILLALAAAIVTAAGTVLVHTGGLEPRTFGTSIAIAIGLTGLLLLVAVAKWAARTHAPAAEASTPKRAVGNPAWSMCGWLIVASTLTTLAAWPHSPYFPYPVTTIIVLTTVCFVTIVSLVATYSALGRSHQALYRLGAGGPYRAGFVTATTLILAAGGVWAFDDGLPARPFHEVRAAVELSKVKRPSGAVDAAMKALCLGAGETEPQLARSQAAPGCRFLPAAPGAPPAPSGEGSDDCFETLMTGPYVEVKGMLASQYPLADAEDAASQAALETCTRQPPPRDLRAFFYTVARNHVRKAARYSRRQVPCVDFEKVAPQVRCDPMDTPENRELNLAILRNAAMCRLNEQERGVADLRLAGHRFRAIGDALGMSEEKAKDTFHNAMRRLRKAREQLSEMGCEIR